MSSSFVPPWRADPNPLVARSMISGSAVVPDVRTTTEIFPATGTAAPAATGTSGAGVVGSNSAMGALAAVGAAIFALL